MELLVIIIFALTVLIYSWFIGHTISSSRKGRIMYVRSNVQVTGQHLLRIVSERVGDTSNVSFVEPGCGLAHTSRFMASLPWKKMVGIDRSSGLLAVARLRNALAHAPIQLIKSDVVDFEYPKGSVIYSYLTTEILDELHVKNKLSGCLVISLTFPISGVEAVEEISLTNWQKRLLVYDFR